MLMGHCSLPPRAQEQSQLMPHAEGIAASLLEQQEQSQLMPHAEGIAASLLEQQEAVSTNASC